MASVRKIIIKNWLLQRRSLTGYLATNSIYRKSRLQVISGPFKGMNYVENSTGGAYFPKLLGTYEKELHPEILNLKNKGIRKVINAGSGEGYFSVGLALQLQDAHVFSLDPSFYGCYLHQRMAAINGVEKRISIHAQYCTPEKLNELAGDGKNTLVFMDVEGAEWQLLDPEKVPGLAHAHMIVEVHDTVSPQLGPDIINRFKNTHTLTEIAQQDRVAADMPYSSLRTKLHSSAFVKLMHEGRGSRMRWFSFAPNSHRA